MPRALVADAQRLGFRLEPAAARVLVERMGANPVRLGNELERLALWAGEGGEVTADDLDAMVADTSEAIVWSLADALQERDPAGGPARSRERLIAQGENVTGMIYGLASRLRRACAAVELEDGVRRSRSSRAWDAPLRGKQLVAGCATPTSATCARRPRPRRPRGLVPRRSRLRRRAGADSRAAGARRALRLSYLARRRRCARLGTSCGRRCSCAARPSARPCRSSRRASGARPRSRSRRRPRRRSRGGGNASSPCCVSSRFSVRSRSLRRIRFFCEAMLAMSRC